MMLHDIEKVSVVYTVPKRIFQRWLRLDKVVLTSKDSQRGLFNAYMGRDIRTQRRMMRETYYEVQCTTR